MKHMRPWRRMMVASAAVSLVGAVLSVPALAESRQSGASVSASNAQIRQLAQIDTSVPPVRNLSAKESKGKWVITWDAPDDDWYDYRVLVNHDWRPQKWMQLETSEEMATLGRLAPGRRYTVIVQAEGDYGPWGRPAETTFQTSGNTSAPWVISLGDSFISGEGGRWAGNADVFPSGRSQIDFDPRSYYDFEDGETIRGCHRSRSAVVHLGTVRSMNLACSGAITSSQVLADTYPGFPDMWKPGIDFENWSNSSTLPDDAPSRAVGQAQLLQEFAQGRDVKMVLLSIGGNNFGFGAIVSACVVTYHITNNESGCRNDRTLSAKLNVDGQTRTRNAIVVAIGNIVRAMTNAGHPLGTWTLGYQTYPRPLPASEDMRYKEKEIEYIFGLPQPAERPRQTRGGCGLWNADIDWALRTAVPVINDTLLAAGRLAVANHPGLRIAYLDATHAFRGHELCHKSVYRVDSGNDEDRKGVSHFRRKGAADKSEWVKEIDLINFSGATVEESFHPNFWGQLALRNCWRQLIATGEQPSGGSCVPAGGVNKRGEPNMEFTPDSAFTLGGSSSGNR